MADEETDEHVSQATGKENEKPKKKTSSARKGGGKSAQRSNMQKEQSKAELETAIRKRVDCEEKAFRIVERLLDNPVDLDFFIGCAQYIDPSHYADVIVERAIVGQCGYPVCNNKLPKNAPKQQFHIDTKHNKVYDITERKNFCSNWCYKASQFYRCQLSTSPVWGREKEPPAPVKLLQRERERSSEVTPRSCSNLDEDQDTKIRNGNATEDRHQLTQEQGGEDLKEGNFTAEHLREKDQENVKETQYQDTEVRFSKLSLSNNNLKQDGTSVVGRDEKTVSDGICEKMPAEKDSTKDDRLVVDRKVEEPQTVNNSEAEQTCMHPGRVQEHVGMVQTMSGEGEEVVLQANPEPGVQARHGTSALAQNVSVAQPVFRSLMEWRTEATFHFLYGDHVKVNLDLPDVIRFTSQEELRAAAGTTLHHGNSHHGDEHHGNNHGNMLSGQEDGTAEKSWKVTVEEEQKDFSKPLSICVPEDPCQNEEEVQQGYMHGTEEFTGDDLGFNSTNISLYEDPHVYQGGPDLDPSDPTPATRPLPDLTTLQRDTELFQMKVQEFYRGSGQLPVSQDEHTEVKENKVKDDEVPVILPPVDSLAQRALQQRILLDRLNRVFPSVLSPLGLSVRDFSTELNLMVKTFRLTSDNIIFRPAELKLLALVLIHILATKVPVIMERLYSPETAQFLISQLQPWRLDLQDLDALVSVMRLG